MKNKKSQEDIMKAVLTPIFVLILSAGLLLSGCSQLIPNQSTLPSFEPTDPQVTAAPPTEADTQPMLEAYQAALEGLCYEHIWPDGSDCGFDSSFGSIETNQFALADVDGDGEQELVISFTTACMAGMEMRIYGCENGQIVEKLSLFPSATVYDNGRLKGLASHNHSMSMDFWPYALYRYDPAANRYQLIATVSGWEKEYYPSDFEDHPFPDEKAEDGMVYRVEQNGAVLVLSPSEFADWEKQVFSGGLELTLDWQSLDPQNIHALSTGLAQDWRRGLSAPESMLWQGETVDVFVCVEEDGIALYPNSPQKKLLAKAEFPRPLDISQLAECTYYLDDLTDNATGDLDIHLIFQDSTRADLLWLWEETGYAYNEEFSFYPGESAKGED